MRLGLVSDVNEALGNLRAQKARTFLTALGIVFGVGSVIAMLSIGAGAREESLRLIEKMGVKNVLVDSLPATSAEELQQRRRASQGLNERDVRILEANLEGIDAISPRRTLHPARVLPKPAGSMPALQGVKPAFSAIHALSPMEGRLLVLEDEQSSAAVCVLGQSAKINLLGFEPAVGKKVKVNDTWLEVVGVLDEQVGDAGTG